MRHSARAAQYVRLVVGDGLVVSISAILIGLYAGLLRGGLIRNLGLVRIEWWGLLIVGVLMPVVVDQAAPARAATLVAISLVAIIVFTLRNRALVGMSIVAIGLGADGDHQRDGRAVLALQGRDIGTDRRDAGSGRGRADRNGQHPGDRRYGQNQEEEDESHTPAGRRSLLFPTPGTLLTGLPGEATPTDCCARGRSSRPCATPCRRPSSTACSRPSRSWPAS